MRNELMMSEEPNQPMKDHGLSVITALQLLKNHTKQGDNWFIFLLVHLVDPVWGVCSRNVVCRS